MKVNVGCGRDIREGWWNIDGVPTVGVDQVVDLDRPDHWKFELGEPVTEWNVQHVIEHITNQLWLLEAMWEASAEGAVARFACPYGSSDDAWEDPTHVRPMYQSAWGYFASPSYWKADYGYRGDWRVEQVQLLVPAELIAGLSATEAFEVIRSRRNTVNEMKATLVAVKPARPPDKDLREPLNLQLVEVS